MCFAAKKTSSFLCVLFDLFSQAIKAETPFKGVIKEQFAVNSPGAVAPAEVYRRFEARLDLSQSLNPIFQSLISRPRQYPSD